MKKELTLSFLLLLLLTSCGSKIKNASPDEFAQSAVACMATGDYESFRELIVTGADVDRLIDQDPSLSNEQKAKFKESKKEHFRQVKKESKAAFDRLKSLEPSYQSCKYLVVNSDGTDFISRLTINVLSKGREKTIYFVQMARTETGWKSMGAFDVE